MELTPQEEREVLARRERQRINAAGLYGGPLAKRDAQQSNLLAQLTEVNERGFTAGFGEAPYDTDAETLAEMKRIQAIGFGLKTANGILVPFLCLHDLHGN